jgi:hypothetical protein
VLISQVYLLLNRFSPLLVVDAFLIDKEDQLQEITRSCDAIIAQLPLATKQKRVGAFRSACDAAQSSGYPIRLWHLLSTRFIRDGQQEYYCERLTQEHLKVLLHMPTDNITDFSGQDPLTVSTTLRKLAEQILSGPAATPGILPLTSLLTLAEKKHALRSVEVRFWMRFEKDLQILKRGAVEYFSKVTKDTYFPTRVQLWLLGSSYSL